MTYDQMLEHLHFRGYDLYDPEIVVSEDTVTFPLKTMSGIIVGFQQYRPTGNKKCNEKETAKYWTYSKRPTCRYWFPHDFKELVKKTNYVFVSEGIFSAAPISTLGFPSVALLSNNNREAIRNLYLQGYNPVAILDGDKASKEIAKSVMKYEYCEPGQDVGDLWETDKKELLMKIERLIK